MQLRTCPTAKVCSRQPSHCTGQSSAGILQRQPPVCTCRQALKEGFTARQFRLMFALSPWEKGLQYGPQLSEEMAAKEGMLKNFFQNIEVALRQSTAGGPSPARWEVRPLLLTVSERLRVGTLLSTVLEVALGRWVFGCWPCAASMTAALETNHQVSVPALPFDTVQVAEWQSVTQHLVHDAVPAWQ